MIRVPTTPEVAYAWYLQALAAQKFLCDPPVIHEDNPQPGFFKRRFDRSGVWVPARIWIVQHVNGDGDLTQPESFACTIGDDTFDAFEVWVELCKNPITRNEYEHLMRVRAWARTQRPDQPEATPTKPIDWMTVAPPHWGKQRKKRETQ